MTNPKGFFIGRHDAKCMMLHSFKIKITWSCFRTSSFDSFLRQIFVRFNDDVTAVAEWCRVHAKRRLADVSSHAGRRCRGRRNSFRFWCCCCSCCRRREVSDGGAVFIESDNDGIGNLFRRHFWRHSFHGNVVCRVLSNRASLLRIVTDTWSCIRRCRRFRLRRHRLPFVGFSIVL